MCFRVASSASILLPAVGMERCGNMRYFGLPSTSSLILVAIVFAQMGGCTKDELRRSFLSRSPLLHREYHLGPPMRTIREVVIDFEGQFVEAIEGSAITRGRFLDPAYQRIVRQYMDDELHGAGLLDSTKPGGYILSCRFARVSSQFIPEGFPLRKTASELVLDCHLKGLVWRRQFVGEGKTSGQGPQSIRESIDIAIDHVTQNLIIALAEQLGASGNSGGSIRE